MIARTALTVLLLIVLAAAPSSSSRSDDTKVTPERSVGLTGTYLELAFTGLLEIEDRGEDCVYKIPKLTILFRQIEKRITTIINLDNFRVVVVAPHQAEKPKSATSYMLEQRYPIQPPLKLLVNDTGSQSIEFSVPKRLMHQAEYLAFGLTGQATMKGFVQIDKDDPSKTVKVENVSRVIWPIPINDNIISHTTDSNGEHGTIVYRQPRDPNDDCSSAKIR